MSFTYMCIFFQSFMRCVYLNFNHFKFGFHGGRALHWAFGEGGTTISHHGRPHTWSCLRNGQKQELLVYHRVGSPSRHLPTPIYKHIDIDNEENERMKQWPARGNTHLLFPLLNNTSNRHTRSHQPRNQPCALFLASFYDPSSVYEGGKKRLRLKGRL